VKAKKHCDNCAEQNEKRAIFLLLRLELCEIFRRYFVLCIGGQDFAIEGNG